MPLALALLVALALWAFHATDTLNRTVFDRETVATANPALIPTNGVLILVDEASLKEIGERYSVRWPWPRAFFAAMIASLHQAGAEKILMDFEFLEPSEDSAQDDTLAAFSAACPEVVLGRTHDKIPIFWQSDFQKQFPQFAVSNRLGLVDFAPDGDGVYRHYPFANSLASKATARDVIETNLLLRWYGGLKQLSTNAILSAAPFVVLGAKNINATEPESAAQELAALPPLNESIAPLIRNKVVFIGANAAGTSDLKATPVGKIEPGALVHFTAWANAERGDYIKPFSSFADLLAGAIFIAAIIFTGWKFPSAALIAGICVALELVLFGGNFLAFHYNYFFPPALPVICIGLALTASVSHNFWRESRRKREIQGIFGSYVSKEIVEKLLKHPDAIKLGGEKKELTVFFSDLAGFTDLSEKLPPEELVQVVNRYLAEITNFILENKGFVDKYIGDAVMGVFGSPKELENHAVAACRAAIASRDWMATAFADSPVKLKVRIGLNTGEMVVGNVGSERKKNFTVLGDSVNLASRLEAANKDVGTTILIGEDTERLARGQFLVRPIAWLRVKGKQQPNQTYELICEMDKADAETKEFVGAYTAAYKNFLKKEFAAALAQFRHALAIRPADKMTQLYLDRAVKFEYETLIPDWDVLELKSK